MKFPKFFDHSFLQKKELNYLTLQWHITDLCNLRCNHCYQESENRANPDFEFLTTVLEQYLTLLVRLERERRIKVRGHINITGGEPLIRDDFLALLLQIKRLKISFAILTNGSLINNPTARYLKSLAPKYVQVSMEGMRKTHDSIRGQGNFEKTTKALKILTSQGLTTLVSFTAHKGNYKDFPEVAEICKELGVDHLWADRLIPLGKGKELAKLILTREETFAFFQLMHSSRSTKTFWGNPKKSIVMHRALQFQVSKETIYRCRAGGELITVMPDGEVFPCRRMPISVGNLKVNSLSEIYFESPLLKKLRNRKQISKGCEECKYQAKCQGGLRCLSYAVFGDPFRADPGCSLASAPPTTASTSTTTPTATTTTTGTS